MIESKALLSNVVLDGKGSADASMVSKQAREMSQKSIHRPRSVVTKSHPELPRGVQPLKTRKDQRRKVESMNNGIKSHPALASLAHVPAANRSMLTVESPLIKTDSQKQDQAPANDKADPSASERVRVIIETLRRNREIQERMQPKSDNTPTIDEEVVLKVPFKEPAGHKRVKSGVTEPVSKPIQALRDEIDSMTNELPLSPRKSLNPVQDSEYVNDKVKAILEKAKRSNSVNKTDQGACFQKLKS